MTELRDFLPGVKTSGSIDERHEVAEEVSTQLRRPGNPESVQVGEPEILR